MIGKDFIAVRELFVRAGNGFRRVAAVGETCEKVDPKSLPALYASGKIRAAVIDEAETKARAKSKKKRESDDEGPDAGRFERGE